MRAPLKLLKEKFTAPTSWDDVTVIEFTKLSKWAKATPNDLHKLWVIFSGLDEALIKRVTLEKLLRLDHILKFLEAPIDLSDVREVNSFMVDGQLVTIDKDLNFITYGQYIAAEKLVNQIRKVSKGKKINPLIIAEKAPELAAVILYPQFYKGDFVENKSKELAKVLENCKFVDIYPAVLFFCERFGELKSYVSTDYTKRRTITRLGRVLKSWLSTANGKQ